MELGVRLTHQTQVQVIRLTGDLKWPQMLMCLLHNHRDQTQRAPQPSSEEKMDEGWLPKYGFINTSSKAQMGPNYITSVEPKLETDQVEFINCTSLRYMENSAFYH